MNIEHLRRIARSGGISRMKKYGNPGTREGRHLGGLHSVTQHAKKPNGFKTLQIFKKPKQSEDLAELLGILFGDGHLSHYQASITTNSDTDKEHILFVKKLIEKLFRVKVNIRKKLDQKALEAVISSRDIVAYFEKLGMPAGNKLKNGLQIPSWILKSPTYRKGFIRGLYDADGCLYLDSHKIKNKQYSYVGWTITSYAGTLRNDIVEILRGFGLHPTLTDSQKSVYLRKQADIRRYFKIIGSHNFKHLNRYKKFGGVA
jgi:intein/homing endonuclease